MLTRILCATDGSRSAERGVAFAIELARRIDAPVTFLAVTAVTRETAARSPFWDGTLLAAGEALTQAGLAAAVRLAGEAGLARAEYAAAQGRQVGRAIAAFAEAHGHDHIVVGSRGAGGVERLILGSVAQDVAAAARCPVTIVH